MQEIAALEATQMKTKLPKLRVGDTIRVSQRISEGKKSRVQVFEGLLIRYRKPNSLQAFITVRKIASGVGVEKSWLMHSPTVEQIQVVKRSKVRRAFLSYMRDRSGKSARLAEMGFDKSEVNAADHRTKDQIAEEDEKAKQEAAELKAKEAEAKAEIKKEVDADGDAAAKDDVLNQPDTESTEDEVKKEDKAAAQDEPTSSEDNEPSDAPQDEKKNAQGNDEQVLAKEEAEAGVEKDDK